MRTTTALATALTAALTAVAGVGLARRHRRVVTPIAPELRNPQLYVPMSLRSDVALRVGRSLMTKTVPPVAEGVTTREELVPATAERPGVRVVVYDTADRARPSGALVWIHGGGLVMGTPEVGNDVASRFAKELGIVVVSVDYRLAPEHPFPAGLDDCVAALEWTHRHADELGVDPARIALGGDSAGGGLAACVAQAAHDRGDLPVCFQLLQYPMLDDRTAQRGGIPAAVWTNASNRFAWTAYLGHPAGEADDRPYAVAARRDDLSGLPPAWIGVGDADLFHDECVEYAARLRADGVECELHVVPGMYHAAERFSPDVTSMRDFLDRMVAALHAATARVGAPTS